MLHFEFDCDGIALRKCAASPLTSFVDMAPTAAFQVPLNPSAQIMLCPELEVVSREAWLHLRLLFITPPSPTPPQRRSGLCSFLATSSGFCSPSQAKRTLVPRLTKLPANQHVQQPQALWEQQQHLRPFPEAQTQPGVYPQGLLPSPLPHRLLHLTALLQPPPSRSLSPLKRTRSP